MSNVLDNITILESEEIPEIIQINDSRKIKYNPWSLIMTELNAKSKAFMTRAKETIKQFIKK